MNTIRKTGNKNTYFKGNFYIRDNSKANWANPIDFPTVFVAFGKSIKSGNWQSGTGINTPKYVIEHYFNNKIGNLSYFWECVYSLELITWDDVKRNKDYVLDLINAANNELIKLETLK